jgi:hypothetical protein
MQVTGVTSLSTSPLSLGHANLHISAERRAHGGYINIAASMDVLHPDRYERVRDSLLHLGLRQITEEPGPDQPANFARRRARFKEHRQKLTTTVPPSVLRVSLRKSELTVSFGQDWMAWTVCVFFFWHETI